MFRKKKTLQELTIKDNFMFAAVMLEPENAKGLLELALGIEIEHVEISQEKSIVYNPEYKGVRLDVFVKDGNGRHFNVEMQAASQMLQKRARYYHSQMDMELLVSGTDYESLPDSYVLFICDFDPLGLGMYRYSIRQTLNENWEFTYSDGSQTVFLSTVGTNETEVPKALVNFLKFVAADISESEYDYDDDFVTRLQNSVRKIKTSRDMEGRYMIFEEMMKNEYKSGHEDGKAEGLQEGRREGRREGRLEGKAEDVRHVLKAKYTISDILSERIRQVKSEEKLNELLIIAVKAASVEEFEDKLAKILADQVKSDEKQINQ